MPIISPEEIPIRPDGLQLIDERNFQERVWRAERIAWVSFGAIMLAALLGVFGGGGPMNERTLHFEAAEVELPRVLRSGSATDTLIAFRTAGPHQVAIPCAAVPRGLIVETPGGEWQGGCGSTRVAPPDESGSPGLALRLTAERAGLVRFSLRIDGADRDATFIVLP